MTPTITHDGETATLTADADFLRLLVNEARRSGQAQLGAFGVSTSWRNFWTGKVRLFDDLLAQLPSDKGAPEKSEDANFDAVADAVYGADEPDIDDEVAALLA